MFEGCTNVGAWFTGVTKIEKPCVLVVAFAVAVTEDGNVPEVPNAGAIAMLPVRVVPTCAFDVSVAKTGSDAVNVIASPSASVAEIPAFAVDPAATVTFPIAASTTGRSTFTTVIVNDRSLFKLPSLARTVAEDVPASANPGARSILPVPVPVPGVTVTTVMYVGPVTFENVSAFPSGSVAVNV